MINLLFKSSGTTVLRPGLYGTTYFTFTEQPHMLCLKINDQNITNNMRMIPSPLNNKKWITAVNHHLDRPYFVDARNKYIVVSEYYGQCISVFTSEGVHICTFGSKGDGPGELHCPSGIAITEDNHVLVVDKNNMRIQKFTIEGDFVAAVGSQGSGPLQFSTIPVGLSIHPRTGKIYVCDCDNHRIQVINPDFTFSHEFGLFGLGKGQLHRPFDVAFDNDLVYVADKQNHRVQIFTLQGEYVSDFGNNHLRSPEGIATDAQNDVVYVSDLTQHNISLFRASTGEFLRSIGCFGKKEVTTFNEPCGMVVNNDGALIICDKNNNRLQIF